MSGDASGAVILIHAIGGSSEPRPGVTHASDNGILSFFRKMIAPDEKMLEAVIYCDCLTPSFSSTVTEYNGGCPPYSLLQISRKIIKGSISRQMNDRGWPKLRISVSLRIALY